MASSNRHWPSMFKSRPCNPHHHQWQPDHNITPLLSNPTSHKSPFSSSERSADPKPRWNPKREQIQILEAIFNSGMMNPPRDEIRRIRAELEEYGQVGDANVFYWFQNRKSRTKHKLRHLNQTTTNKSQPPYINLSTTTAPPPSSSSSSSDKSSQKSSNNKKSGTSFPMVNVTDHGLNSHSPTASVNQPYFRTSTASEFLPEPYFFQMPPVTGGITTLSNGISDHGAAFSQGFCFPPADHETSLVSSTSNAVIVHDNGCHDDDHAVGKGSNVLLTDLMNFGPLSYKKLVKDHDKIKTMQPQQSTHVTSASVSASAAHTILLPPSPPTTTIITSTVNQIQGLGEGKTTLFINDVAFEVAVGPFNVREAFGDDAVLINSWGQPVETNEWGVTLQSLQHGALYYLVRTLPDPSH